MENIRCRDCSNVVKYEGRTSVGCALDRATCASLDPDIYWSCDSFRPKHGGSDEAAPAATEITAACDAVKALLLAKNAKYGNSALEPARVFSKASPVEQLLVRIDDKISRVRTSGTDLTDEDTVNDLIGYLVLLKIAQARAAKVTP